MNVDCRRSARVAFASPHCLIDFTSGAAISVAECLMYRQASRQAVQPSRRWHPDRRGPVYREFFESIRPQPFPPEQPTATGPQAGPPGATGRRSSR